jgi:hypothetical protein
MDDLLLVDDVVRNRRMLCICYIFLRCGLSSEGRNSIDRLEAAQRDKSDSTKSN